MSSNANRRPSLSRSRARASIAGEVSIPRVSAAPIRSCSTCVSSPVPHPRSTTRPPRTGSTSANRSKNGCDRSSRNRSYCPGSQSAPMPHPSSPSRPPYPHQRPPFPFEVSNWQAAKGHRAATLITPRAASSATSSDGTPAHRCNTSAVSPPCSGIGRPTTGGVIERRIGEFGNFRLPESP